MHNGKWNEYFRHVHTQIIIKIFSVIRAIEKLVFVLCKQMCIKFVYKIFAQRLTDCVQLFRRNFVCERAAIWLRKSRENFRIFNVECDKHKIELNATKKRQTKRKYFLFSLLPRKKSVEQLQLMKTKILEIHD